MADATPPPSSGNPPSYREDALAVVKRLRDNGHVAYFAGGCVRDTLLGLEPKDWDVATDAPPVRVRQLFTNTQAVGAAFGVILVRHSRSQIEVATFRSDLEYQDGRHPVGVRFTSAEEDAKRRDFTINGLFLDPIDNRVIDYVGGQEDLKAKILRAIGDPNHRFEEDHLRMLRAVRFAARFGLEVESATSAAIRTHATQLARISPERIAEELRMILSGPDANWAWFAMRLEYPGLAQTLFRFAGPPPQEIPPKPDPAVLHSVPDGSISFGLGLAAISLEWAMLQRASWDVRPLVERRAVQATVRALRQALRFSNEESDELEGTLLGVGLLLEQNSPSSVATLKRFLARPTASLSRRLLLALKCQIGASVVDAIETRLDEISRTDYAPPPLITGDDLTARGLAPGPLFKRVLDKVYDAQLEDRAKTKDEAIELAMKLASEKA